MIDGCGRTIDHLRLSLTERCNLACRYCAPEETPRPGGMIDAEFAHQVVRWLSEEHGVTHVRLTGGEPLLYPGLLPLVRKLAALGGLRELTLTTNAQALAKMARPLRDAGISRLNISLDTLDPDRFRELTRGGELRHTLAGVEAGVKAGLTPVKINVVAQRGLNDDELPDIAEWGLNLGCTVRFLEVMPIGPLSHVVDQHLVPADEIVGRLGARFEMREIDRSNGQPSVDYEVVGAGVSGRIGIIAPTTRPFCSCCRRLRVTSRGLIVACLHDNTHFNLAEFWDGTALDTERADALLRIAVDAKPEQGSPAQTLTMLTMGG